MKVALASGVHEAINEDVEIDPTGKKPTSFACTGPVGGLSAAWLVVGCCRVAADASTCRPRVASLVLLQNEGVVTGFRRITKEGARSVDPRSSMLPDTD